MGQLIRRPVKPRVIRRVTERDKTGRPKWVRDYKIDALMQRVKARDPRPCANTACPHGNHIGWSHVGVIMPRTEYVKVHANEGRPKIIRGRAIYSPRDYHFDCVPEQYRPMIRFLVPPA